MNDKQELVNAELVKDVTEAIRDLHDNYFDTNKKDWLWSLSIKIKAGKDGKPDTFQATLVGHDRLHFQGYKYTFGDYLPSASSQTDGRSLFEGEKENEDATQLKITCAMPNGEVQEIDMTTGEVKQAAKILKEGRF